MLRNNGKISIGRYLLISVFVICLMFVAFGYNVEDSYAVDVNQTAEDAELDIDANEKLENSQTENDMLEESSNEEEVLGATHKLNGGTFKDIRQAIKDANSGDTIQLSGTFKASEDLDKIRIDKKITITSTSQATLDGKKSSSIFYVNNDAKGTVLSNLKLINGVGERGGAMLIFANDVTVNNCVFENNYATLAGGAISSKYDAASSLNLVIKNCKFTKNHAKVAGGAVTLYGDKSKVINCVFDSNYASNDEGLEVYGGAIQLSMDEVKCTVSVEDSKFTNNWAKSNSKKPSHGGAGCLRDGVTYARCTFTGNSADQGGALTFHASGKIEDCVFTSNTAKEYGGALSTGFLYNEMDLNIVRCSFTKNSAPLGGAAQLKGENINIKNSNFTDNVASKNGGAINGEARTVTITNSNFKNNVANVDGGGVFIKGKNTVIQDSVFDSNDAIPDANKLNDGLGGAIYVNSTSANIQNNVFKFNTARNGSAIYYDNAGVNLKVTDNAMTENQAWVYALPISAEDINYGEDENISSVIHGGNNIARYGNLAVSNAIYNAAKNEYITVDGYNPIDGATNTGELYQDDREYNIDILLTVKHDDGTVVYDNNLKSSYLGEIGTVLSDLKPGKYYVTAKHYEDTYYKAITNTTTFTVYPKIDNQIKITPDKDEYDFEDVATWTIDITNNGPNSATGVIVRELLPDGLIYFADTSNGLYDPETGILNISTLDVGESISFSIQTIINRTGNISNAVNITANENDTNMTNNFDKRAIKVNPAADIMVTKTANNTSPNYGDLVNWTIVVRNNGPDVAHNVTLSDIIPNALVPVSISGNYDSKRKIWQIDSLDVGEEVSFSIITLVNATGMIENTAHANASEYDYDPSNNEDGELIKVRPAVDLSITKLVNVTQANYQDSVKWTLVIKNNGLDNATGVKITDVLPDDFIYINSTLDYQDGIIDVGNLASGEEISIDIICKADSTGNFTNVANVTGNEYDYDMSNNEDNESISVSPACDLEVTKTVDESEPDLGDRITWTIIVRNNGPDVAHDIDVCDKLPDSLIWIEDDSDGDYGPQTGVWHIEELGVDEEITLDITCQVNRTGVCENNVNVTAREFDYDLSNNQDNESIEVEPAADLSIEKTVNATSVNYQDTVRWTLTVRNDGPDDATGVRIYDVLPEGFIYINSTFDYADGEIDIGDLASGEKISVDIICKVNVTGNFTNFANVSANEFDWNLSNNEDNESIIVNLACDLAVNKTVDVAEPNLGDRITWTITVMNNGPDTAHDINVYDKLPDSLVWIEDDSNGDYSPETGIWKINCVDAGGEARLNIICQVKRTGFIENDVNVTAREFDYDLSNNKDNESINVKPASDLLIIKLVNATPVNYLDTVKWTLTVINYGPDDATGVRIYDVLPEGFIYTNSTLKYDNNAVEIGDLAVGESRSVDIICMVNVTGNFTNVANVSANEFDQDLSNNEDNESVTVNPACDLEVNKTVDVAEPNLGDRITWTITVMNNGPDSAHDVHVCDKLPDSLVWVEDDSNGDYNPETGVWKIDSVDVGAEVRLNIICQVNRTGFIGNGVNVTAREFDYDLSNNRDNERVNVKPACDLSIVKSVNAAPVNYLDTVKWTLTVINNGPDDATGVKITDVLPEGFIYVNSTLKYDNNAVEIGDLEVGESRSVDIICMVNVTGNFTNVANVSANEFDQDLSNNEDNESVIVNPACDLAVNKTVDVAEPNLGDRITWTITVMNNGPDTAHDIKVCDKLPDSLVWVEDDSNGDYNPETGVWKIDSVDVGAEVRLNIVSRVNRTGFIGNGVNVTAREFDYDLSNNRDNERVNVKPACDLSIVKSVNATPVNYHDTVKWTLIIRNDGPDDATNIKVTDVLPEGFIYINSTLEYADGEICIGNLAVGESISVDIVCMVNATGNFTNFANVTADEFDQDLTNNMDNESITVNPACDLAVRKTVDVDEPKFGSRIVWTITVVNNGPDTAHDIKVQDMLPDSLIWIEDYSNGQYNPKTGIWQIDSLEVSKEQTLTVTCMVNRTGLTVNEVNVTASEFDYVLSNNHDNESITAEPAADVCISKSVNNTNPNYRDMVKWTIIVSNNGPDKATSVLVTEKIPEGMIIINSTASKGFFDNGMWSVCCLENGEVETLEIICQVNVTGTTLNVAEITAHEYDPDLENNMADESIEVPPSVDIEVIHDVDNLSPLFGETFIWMITVKNNGPDNATEVELRDILPDSVSYVGYNSTRGDYVVKTISSDSPEVLSRESPRGVYEDNVWKIGKLNVGEVEYLNVTCIANGLGSTVNDADATSLEYDWKMSNNRDDAQIDVRPVADLALEKSVDKTNPNYGDTVTWTLKVSNNGPNDASDVVVYESLPDKVEFIKSSDDENFDGSKWKVGQLNNGEVRELTITCRVTATGTIKNTAKVTASEHDPNPDNNNANKAISVPPASDLSITKIASKYKYTLGDIIEYRIEVVNNGPDAAHNIMVNEILDELLKLKSFKMTKGKFNRFSCVWTIDRLGYGESAVLYIKAIATGAGIIKNTISVTSDSFDYDTSNNKDFAVVKVADKTSKVPPKAPENKNAKSVNHELSNLEKHPTANPLAILVVSCVFSIMFLGENILKKR